jgi:hypothetical protein
VYKYLLPQAMKSSFIYREWKRDILFFIVLNLGPRFGPKRFQEKYQVIIFVQVLSNLMKGRGIKCTCKVALWAVFFREKLKKKMNSNHNGAILIKFNSVLRFFISLNYTPVSNFQFYTISSLKNFNINPRFQPVFHISPSFQIYASWSSIDH